MVWRSFEGQGDLENITIEFVVQQSLRKYIYWNKKITPLRHSLTLLLSGFFVSYSFRGAIFFWHTSAYKRIQTEMRLDAIFLPLTRAWGAEGCDEAGWGRPSRSPIRARAYSEVFHTIENCPP